MRSREGGRARPLVALKKGANWHAHLYYVIYRELLPPTLELDPVGLYVRPSVKCVDDLKKNVIWIHT